MFSTRYRFDFESDWRWIDLYSRPISQDTGQLLDALRSQVSIEDAIFIFTQLSRLDSPDDVKKLREYCRIQFDMGGGFHGTIPELLTDESEIPVPVDLPTLVECALWLSTLRKSNLENIDRAGFYPRQFKGKLFQSADGFRVPEHMTLKLDLSGVQLLLSVLAQETVSLAEAMRVANHPAFVEMIRHRHELGYIPQPLATSESLAWFIQQAGSREPLDMIWKWLNPWNCFDLADLYFNLGDYGRVISLIAVNQEEIVNQVLARIGQFAPAGFHFEDQICFAVGWGIKGWATEKTGGINIEHFKDDFDLLIRTITHETYHRLQLLICPVDPSRSSKTPREFEDLAFWSFPNEKDRKFYEVISYIFLEGSAKFVEGYQVSLENAVVGLQLLDRIWDKIYEENEISGAEYLLNLGLKSSGPFYSLGCYMASQIAELQGPEGIIQSLAKGAVEFFKKYFSACLQVNQPSPMLPKKQLTDTITAMERQTE